MTSGSKYIAAVLFLGGCSVINSFDAVKPALTEAGTGSAGKGGKTGGGTGGESATEAGASGGSAGKGGSTGTDGSAPEAGQGGTSTGGKGAGGGGPSNEAGADVFVPGGNGGIIVAYQKPPAPASGQLVVVEPKEGKQLSMESIGAVKGIANDGLTDLWYIFEQPGAAKDPVILHVRELRILDGKWHEIGTVPSVPQPTSRIVALHGRIAYLSTPVNGTLDQATYTLTVLDVSDPTNVTVFGGAANATRPLPAGRKQSILGKPGGGIGGTIDVLYIGATCSVTDDSGVTTCPMSLAAYSVGAGSLFSPGATKVIGKVLPTGTARFDRDAKRDAVVVAFPSRPAASDPNCSNLATAPDTGTVEKFSPLDFSGIGQAPVSYAIESESVTGTAYDACLDTMFITTQNYDHGIWAIPLSGGGAAPLKLCRGAGAASMQFEPYTRTLIRVPTGGGTPEFLAVGGSATAPALNPITLAKLLPDFSPLVIGLRQPPGYNQVCP